MTDAASAPEPTVLHLLHLLALLTTLVGNLIPLFGVLYWGWDTFQLLMLYWMETVILAFWTLRRLARLPAGQAGNITINGKTGPATNAVLVGFFAFHSGIFIVVHLVFLWVLFSGAWLKKVHGPASFFTELLLVNGIWVALVLFFIAAWVSFLVDAKPHFQRKFEQAYRSTPLVAQALEKAGGDGVGAVVGPLYVRIIIMLVAILFGAWFAQVIGSLAPLVLVIALKTLVDLALGSHIPLIKDLKFSSSEMSAGS